MAAQARQVSERTIRRLISCGQLPAYKFGGSVRIYASDLDKVMKPVTPLAEHVELERELAGGGAQ
ncbi:MAG: helix-turn-helix domain-containing protein [Ancrocorticia sp.]|nr:helix-turn-helix domain-containing protein [Ancrocorticia sp.]MCI2002436.1 helix-turn-helix domain-containing protein [Ancrocorticia sp.]